MSFALSAYKRTWLYMVDLTHSNVSHSLYDISESIMHHLTTTTLHPINFPCRNYLRGTILNNLVFTNYPTWSVVDTINVTLVNLQAKHTQAFKSFLRNRHKLFNEHWQALWNTTVMSAVQCKDYMQMLEWRHNIDNVSFQSNVSITCHAICS